MLEKRLLFQTNVLTSTQDTYILERKNNETRFLTNEYKGQWLKNMNYLQLLKYHLYI